VVNCAYHNWVGLPTPIRCPAAGGCGNTVAKERAGRGATDAVADGCGGVRA